MTRSTIQENGFLGQMLCLANWCWNIAGFLSKSNGEKGKVNSFSKKIETKIFTLNVE